MTKFYGLDFFYQLRGGKPHFVVWGLDKKKHPVMTETDAIVPHFYVSQQDYDLHSGGRLKKKDECFWIDQNMKLWSGGMKRSFAKINTHIPSQVPDLADFAENFGMRTYARDVFYRDVCIEQLQIKPCSVITDSFEQTDEEWIPEMRQGGLDIEVYNPRRMPKFTSDPVILASMADSDPDKFGEPTVKTWCANDNNSDVGELKGLFSDIRKSDYDIIWTFAGNDFDMPYIHNRCRHLEIPTTIGRDGSTLRQTSYGMYATSGRVLYDLMDYCANPEYMKRDKRSIFVSLEESARKLIGMKLIDVPKHLIWKYWDDKIKREKLVKYNRRHALATLKIGQKVLPFNQFLSKSSKIPMMFVGKAGMSRLFESALMWEAVKRDYVIPNKVRHKFVKTKGALTLQPSVHGIKSNVAVLDFKGMYPAIAIKWNLGFDTYDPTGEKGEIEAPYVHHKFLKKPKSMVSGLLENFRERRNDTKDQSENWALKILMNAALGYFKYQNARWYCPPVNESTTAYGRKSIRKVLEFAKKHDIKIYSGDTDSTFLKNIHSNVNMIIGYVTNKLGMAIKIDEIYKYVLFTDAKKHYAYMDSEGRIGVKGLESKRTDWCQLASNTQLKMLKMMFNDKNPDRAVRYARRVIDRIRNKEIDFDDLVITKRLGKNPEEYGTNTAQGVIGEKLHRKIGEPVSWVVVNGKGKLYEKVMPPNRASYDDIDLDYYIYRQIKPAAWRVLAYFKGLDHRTLSRDVPQSILDVS